VVDREYLGFVGECTPEEAGSNRERERRLAAVLEACRALVQGPLRLALDERCQGQLTAVGDWQLSEDADDVDGQTLLLRYPTAFPLGGSLRRVVKIELGARSDTEPSLRPCIRPYLAEALPEAFRGSEIVLRTVAPERTFWEKAMLLHEETYTAGPGGPKVRLSRHYYDLWCLIRAGVAERAAQDGGLFNRVAEHRRLFFRRRREAQETLRPGLLRLVPPEDQLPHWRRDYEAMREFHVLRRTASVRRGPSCRRRVSGQLQRGLNERVARARRHEGLVGRTGAARPWSYKRSGSAPEAPGRRLARPGQARRRIHVVQTNPRSIWTTSCSWRATYASMSPARSGWRRRSRSARPRMSAV